MSLEKKVDALLNEQGLTPLKAVEVITMGVQEHLSGSPMPDLEWVKLQLTLVQLIAANNEENGQ